MSKTKKTKIDREVEEQFAQSMPPIEELKVAGVDMSTPQPVCEALDYFAELVGVYSGLLSRE